MSTETDIKNKLQELKDWMPAIIECIKRDLKNEHLKKDLQFAKHYFGTTNISKLDTQDLSKAYIQAIDERENGKEIAEFIAHRWIFRNSEMYQFFEMRLSAIHPNFTEIIELPNGDAKILMDNSIQEFGALKTYIFAMLNCVAFSNDILQKLKLLACEDCKALEENKRISAEKRSYEDLIFAHSQEIARTVDKYEKKLSGIQKKYMHDVGILKKQIAQLQRRLAEV